MNVPHTGPVVSVDWLHEHRDDDRVVVLDATVLLPPPRHDGDYRYESGYETWKSGHIPGSKHVDLARGFSDSDAPLSFTRAAPDVLAQAFRDAGVMTDGLLVTYDVDAGLWASRLWWLARSIGVEAVVLDGGLPAWRQAGLPVISGDDADARSGDVVARPQPGMWADLPDVLDVVEGRETGTLVCTLGREQYDGSAPTRYSRRGHIPGSGILPARELSGDRLLLPPEEIARRAQNVLTSSPVILYCGGGIAACQAALALTTIGVSDIRVYDGSLAEWTRDPSLPVVNPTADADSD